MAFFSRSLRSAGTLVATTMALALGACSDSSTSATPDVPEEPSLPPAVRQAAFVFDVDMRKQSVNVLAPNGASVGSLSLRDGSLRTSGGRGPDLSILAGDVVELTTSNFTASGVGQGGAPAGRVYVSFDVQVLNRLGSVRLIRPTFPAPPAGLAAAQQVLLFPFAASTIVTTGGTGTEGDGTTIVVEQPSRGAVEAAQTDASRDGWDGAPHNFFSDSLRACTLNPNCFLYEAFPVIQPNEQTTGRRVGFVIDPTVNRFRARLLVAADLENAVAQFGTIAGNVSSVALGGGVSGVTVSAGPGLTAVTSATGDFSIANVPVGNRTVSVSTLPPGCSAAAQPTLVGNAATSTVNFALLGCTVPAGTVTGQINFTGSIPSAATISAITVQITPDGRAALPAVALSATGALSVPSVPTIPNASGRITAISNLPANCTAPTLGAGLLTYTGLTLGGSAAIAPISIACAAPPILYGFTVTLQPSTRAGAPANEFEAVYAIDLSVNRPDNYGAAPDSLAGIQIDLAYDNTRLTPVTGTAGRTANSDLDSPTYNPALTASSTRIAFVSLGGLQVGGANIVLGRQRFLRNGTAGSPSFTVANVTVGSASNSQFFSLVPFLSTSVIGNIP